jgi:hypothetical protein
MESGGLHPLRTCSTGQNPVSPRFSNHPFFVADDDELPDYTFEASEGTSSNFVAVAKSG